MAYLAHSVSGKTNVETNALSHIPWDRVIEAETVQVVIKAAIEGPKAVMEVYACNVKVCVAGELDPPPQWMTKENWVIAQWDYPDVGKIVKWLNESTLDTVKLGSDNPLSWSNICVNERDMNSLPLH